MTKGATKKTASQIRTEETIGTNGTRYGLKKAAQTIEKRKSEQKKRFLSELRKTNSIIIAADRTGIGRRTAYNWREADSKFAEAWDEALEGAKEDMRVSIHQAALKNGGVERIFLMKHYFPDEFGDRVRLENNPDVQRLYHAFAHIMQKFIPREQLRDATIDLCTLVGYDPRNLPGLVAGISQSGGASTRNGNSEDSSVPA